MKTPQYKQTSCRIARSVLPLLVLVLLSRVAAAQTNTFPSSGNVGVGTTSPNTLLDVRGNTTVVGNVVSEANASQNSGAGLLGQDSSNAYLQLYDSTRAMKVYFSSRPGVNSYLNNGNFGIGTTSPLSKLDIAESSTSPTRGIISTQYTNDTLGSRLILRKARDTSGTSSAAIQGGDTMGLILFNAFDGSVFSDGARISANPTQTWTTSAHGSSLSFSVTPNNSTTMNVAMFLDPNGYAGIGTSSPGGPIDVRDSSGRQLLWNMSGAGHTFLNANGGNVHVAGNLYFNGTNWNRHNTGAAGGMWWAGSDGTLGVLQTVAGANPVAAFNWPLFINTSGYVGMGTNSPAYKLDVQNGAVNASGGLCIAGDCKTAWSQVGGGSQWTTSGSNISYSSGNVGIGTTSSTVPLEVSKAQAATTYIQVTNGNSSAGNGAAMRMFTSGNNALTLGAVGNAGAGGYAAITQEANLPLLFQTNLTERMRITGGGSVGIGTAAPLQKLQIGSNSSAATTAPDTISLGATYSSTARAYPKLRLFDDNAGSVYGLGVSASQLDFMVPANSHYVWSVNGAEKMRLDEVGNLTVSGNIAAKYQDVAEWVPTSQQLSAGTVVVLDSTKSNQVISSSLAYDTRVAGVISGQPGITLGESGEGKVLVATTGRVRVKVDASRGPIRIGDLLVTSDIAGVAMKSEAVDLGGVKLHRPGTLIGKALEPLDKGTGTILVLLSLQ